MLDYCVIYEEQQKGRKIPLPANHYHCLHILFEHAHDLIDDAVEDQVVLIVFFMGAKRLGMCVE